MIPAQYKNFTLGCDPEFIILNEFGKIVSEADSYNNHEFSLDGNGRIAELRVAPSSKPLELVNNIHGIFKRKIQRNKKFLNYNWVAGSFKRNEALGGHIHVGIRQHLTPGDLSGHPNYSDIVTIFDNYVGIVSVLLENKDEGANRREDGDYGNAGNFRLQSHGFEYRVCASWLVTPYVSAAFFCLSKLITFEYLNNPNFDFKRFDCEDIINYTDQNTARKQFPKIWNDIVKMKLYQAYKPYLDFIYFLVENKKSWYPRSSLKESWGIFNPTPKPNEVDLGIIWQKFENS